MNVAIIGAGNVAWHISKAFINAGHPVKQVWSRNPDKAIDIAIEIGANSIASLDQLSDKVDLVILAVSDDAIISVASQLKLQPNQLLVHTSGSTSVNVLQAFAANYGVLYPLQTFSKHTEVDFSKVPIGVEGSSDSVTQNLLQLAKDLTESAQVINSEQRIKLHIAAVFASNFTNYFYSVAQDFLSKSGLSFEIIRPLIEATAKKALSGSPKELQTGPARRNDKETMDKHLQILNENPELKALYEIVSQNIVKMYNENQS